MAKKSEIVVRVPTDEQFKYTREMLAEHERTKPSKLDGDYFQKLFGFVSQIVVGDLLGYERPKAEGYDGGFDIETKGLKLDVKAAIRNTPFRVREFVHNLSGRQASNDCDGYVFCSYNKRESELEICGWITKDAMIKYSTFYEHGEIRERTDGTSFMIIDSNGLFEIKNKWLRPFHELL